MEAKEIIDAIYKAILGYNKTEAEAMAQGAISAGIDLTQLISEGMSPAMDTIGDKFQKGEAYLPELQMAGNVFESAMKLIQPKLLESGAAMELKGRVVIGTVKGDLHSIGKDLVAAMLKTSGFEVVNLGIDIPTLTFLEEAEKANAQVIALSALLTTTMAVQREVVTALADQGLRQKFKVIIGGAPIDQKWADEIGADGYGAVKVVGTMCE